ncbi:hypothetical protein K3172_11265 [Qipengyuania sp. 6B39]|uniref:hypothetical protein n=1 Tax=Qipengyuania proteolytica TaxID=2867239 RepID=UPI001C892DDA|nr:hypothetical protein [Qipengyuania proteolytica]MBX7496433.1 hypothetical protein [Qipengyuania proteolytica]
MADGTPNLTSAPNKPLRGGASGFNRTPGVREMREYPVTSRELWTLGGLQASSALTLSLAGWLFGFWLNAKQALDLADRKTIPATALAQWEAYANLAWWGALGIGILGFLLMGLVGLNVWGIIKDTRHGP